MRLCSLSTCTLSLVTPHMYLVPKLVLGYASDTYALHDTCACMKNISSPVFPSYDRYLAQRVYIASKKIRLVICFNTSQYRQVTQFVKGPRLCENKALQGFVYY